MTQLWISADQIFDGFELLTSHGMCLENEVVTEIKPLSELHQNQISHHHQGLITPGFFDIQVNGGGGVLLNNAPSADTMRQIMDAHHALGSVAILPTIITDRPEVLEAAVEACLDVRQYPRFLGLHIEGPHIARARRGTHAGEYVRNMDAATLLIVRQLRDNGIPVLITIAPESVTQQDMKKLKDYGATISIGHSAASASDVEAVLDRGATCFTHLYNAMPPLKNREPSVAGAALLSQAWCSIIVDHVHVDPIMVKLAFHSRPVADRMILISDAMATVGGPDEFVLYGQTLKLQDGRLVNSEGSLAGAHVTVLQALQNLVALDIPLKTALRASRHNAAHLLGIPEKAGLVGCAAADILWLNDDLTLQSVGISADCAPKPHQLIS